MKAGELVHSSASVTRLESDRATLRWWQGDLVYYCSLFLGSSVIIGLSGMLRVSPFEQVVLPALGNTELPGLCFVRSYFDIACPGCGMVRCFVCLAHGQWRHAWQFNPAGILLFAVIVLQIPLNGWRIYRIARGRPNLDRSVCNGSISSSRFARWTVYVLLVAMLLQWLPNLLGRLM